MLQTSEWRESSSVVVDIEWMVHSAEIAGPETSITQSPVSASSSRAVVGSEDAKTIHLEEVIVEELLECYLCRHSRTDEELEWLLITKFYISKELLQFLLVGANSAFDQCRLQGGAQKTSRIVAEW